MILLYWVMEMKIIKRENYLNELLSLKDKPDIKIITGVRRAGKSFLLNEYIKILEKSEDEINIIRIDFTRIEFDDLKRYKKLNDYIWSKYKEGVKNYLFIDEVQMCEKFEIAINDIYESKKMDIYITGSNAFLLSSDLATLLLDDILRFKYYHSHLKSLLSIMNMKISMKHLKSIHLKVDLLVVIYTIKKNRNMIIYLMF